MPVDNLEYIDIADFSQGIWQRYSSAGPAPDGVAQEDGTWGCYGDPHGGLHPLFQGSSFSAGVSLSPDPGSADVATLATTYMSPVVDDATWADASRAYAILAYHESTTDTHYAFVDLSNGDVIADLSLGSKAPKYAYGHLDISRVNPGAPELPGDPAIFVNMGLSPAGEVFYYPKHGDDLTDPPGSVALFAVEMVMAHQSRLVMGTDAETWGDDAKVPGPSRLDYKDARDPDSSTYVLDVTDESPFGLSSWASMNSNEMFLVKHRGGGAIVRGDISRPQIIRLPGVASGHGAACLGAATPLGYMYGTREGVWSWAGSDACDNVSGNLNPNFWICDDVANFATGQPLSKFAYSYPWLFVGNSWVLDTRNGAWWRLENVDTAGRAFHNYEVGIDGELLAFVPLREDGDPFGLSYDLDSPSARATSYQWTSQPLAYSRRRRVDFREIDVVIQGVGNVTVTLTGINGVTSSKTFTVNSTARPVAMVGKVDCHSHDVVVTIAATGTGGNPAPVVYRTSLGYRESNSVARV